MTNKYSGNASLFFQDQMSSCFQLPTIRFEKEAQFVLEDIRNEWVSYIQRTFQKEYFQQTRFFSGKELITRLVIKYPSSH